MSDLIEAVARAICVAERVDPDESGIGGGVLIEKGKKYKMWEVRIKRAEAAIDAVEKYKHGDSGLLESVCRAICIADNIDPDRTSIGFGHTIPNGVEYKLWEVRIKAAEAAVDAVVSARVGS